MMYVSKYKSHKIALFNSMKTSNLAPISRLCTVVAEFFLFYFFFWRERDTCPKWSERPALQPVALQTSLLPTSSSSAVIFFFFGGSFCFCLGNISDLTHGNQPSTAHLQEWPFQEWPETFAFSFALVLVGPGSVVLLLFGLRLALVGLSLLGLSRLALRPFLHPGPVSRCTYFRLSSLMWPQFRAQGPVNKRHCHPSTVQTQMFPRSS